MVKSKQTSKKQSAAKQRARSGAKKVASSSHGFFADFVSFLREQGVVGLAVGLAIGAAAGASVKVIVDNLVSPIVALFTRGVDLDSLKWVIFAAESDQPEVAIGYGAIISSLITLVATALLIFWLVHVAKLDRLDKKKD